MIEKLEHDEYAVTALCDALSVRRSAYYASAASDGLRPLGCCCCLAAHAANVAADNISGSKVVETIEPRMRLGSTPSPPATLAFM